MAVDPCGGDVPGGDGCRCDPPFAAGPTDLSPYTDAIAKFVRELAPQTQTPTWLPPWGGDQMTFYREPAEPAPAKFLFSFRPGTLVEFLTLGGEVIGRSIVASGDGSSGAPLRLIGDPFGAED